MSSKQPNSSGHAPTSKGSDNRYANQNFGDKRQTSLAQKSPSSTRATDGSTSTMGHAMTLSEQSGGDRRAGTDGNSGKPQGGSWALKQWLEQGPREDPWNPVGGGKD